jgi:nucleotide-binding universal stress UspA family protein
MYERILVPLDGSNAAEIILPYVEEIGAELGSEINLASVSETGATDVNHLYRSYLEQIKEEIQRKVEDYGKKQARVFWKILLGKPADEIMNYANEINVDLIVMASRGSSGQGPWLLGNIAAKVLRASAKPVLLIRATASDMALQEKRLMRRILVPLDGSKVGEAAIPYAEMLAKASGAQLHFLQVLHPVATVGPDQTSVPYVEPVIDESRKASAIAYLDGVAEPIKKSGLSTSRAIALGSPADKIVDYAEANAIDTIAMSTHGRTGVGRWVFGSITDKVLHVGDTPVLVVRAG